MTCHEAALRVLEDVPSVEVDQHIAHCARCRSVRDAHRAALTLRGLGAEITSVTRSEPVPRLWMRRFVARISFVFAVSAAVAVVFIVRSSATKTSPADVKVTSRATAAPSLPIRSALPDTDFEALLREVDSYTRSDVPADDLVLATFGPLPGLLTPSPRNAAVPTSINR